MLFFFNLKGKVLIEFPGMTYSNSTVSKQKQPPLAEQFDELWKALIDGSKDAFMQIYTNHYSILFSYGLKLSSDRELARDCIQEVFTDIWSRRQKLREVWSVKSYLLTIYRRTVLKKVEEENKKIGLDLDSNSVGHIEFSHEDFLIQKQGSDQWEKKLLFALGKLPQRQKEIIYLRFFDNLDYQEISEITSLNYQVVRNQVYKAMLNLKKILISLLIPLIHFL